MLPRGYNATRSVKEGSTLCSVMSVICDDRTKVSEWRSREEIAGEKEGAASS